VEEQEARLAALAVSNDAAAHAVWETKARDWADVLLLAEITWDYFWGLGGVAAFPTLPTDIQNQNEVAVAYLVRGIAEVALAPPA
jgi:hypothetical protein